MMSNVRHCWSLIILLVAAPLLAEDAIPWVADFQAACGMAAEQHRLVLLHFYNDNCGPCVRVDQNVFSKVEVAEAVAQNYIAVKVHAGKSPQLASRYQIRQWPTDVFVTASGLEIYRTVSPQKPEEYIGVLNQVAQQTGIGAARQWKNLMGQVAKPAAAAAAATASNYAVDAKRAASSTAGNLAAEARGAGQQATDQVHTATTHAKQRWNGLGAQFQTAAEQTRSTVERTTQDFTAAAQQTAQQAASTTQQVEQQAADRGQQAKDAARLWSQQTSDAVQQYEKQGGDAYRQFREQTSANQQQIDKQAVTVKEQLQSTTQKTTQDVSGTTQNLKNQLHQASQSLLERRSPFALAESSPASQPVAGEASTPATKPGFVAAQPPALTTNPWVPSNQGAAASQQSPQVPFVPAQPQSGTQEGAGGMHELVLQSKAPPVALDGFCPVTLMEAMAQNPADRGAWKKGDKQFGAIHRGRTYLFTSVEQQKKFLRNPDAFAPVLSGCDPVVYAERGQLVDGKRAYGLVTPEKQVVLFADETSLNRFKQSPNVYSTAVQQAMVKAEGGNLYR